MQCLKVDDRCAVAPAYLNEMFPQTPCSPYRGVGALEIPLLAEAPMTEHFCGGFVDLL